FLLFAERYLMNWYNSYTQSSAVDENDNRSELEAAKTPAEKQFELSEYENTTSDFEELAIQYGYVVLFIVCFPLTPALALINNYVEVYVDSIKLLKLTRRPEPQSASDIGAWH